MVTEDPRMNPETASIWSSGPSQPYARRSITSIFLVITFLVALFGFSLWWFFSPPSDLSPADQRAKMQQQMPENNYAPDSGRSEIYDFFYKMFGGIEDGLEDNPLNLKNMESVDDFNLDKQNLVEGGMSPTNEATSETTPPTNSLENLNDGFRHSAADVIDSDVMGVNGKQAGSVHDIIINKDTGKATAVIVDKEGGYYNRDLTVLRFKSIITQQEDGDLETTITQDSIEEKQSFQYDALNDDDYISLRHLRNGQVLDDAGEVAGEIEAIIYENAEAQNVYFALKSQLNPTNTPKIFGLPFEAVKIVKGPDGYDIQLTEEQTKSLAEKLYSE